MAATSYEQLIQRVRDASLLGSCAAVLGWDEQTYMPANGSALRGDQMALLARLGHEAMTHPIIGELLAAAEPTEEVQAANVREIRRAYDRAVKLPKDLVEEMARVTTRAQAVWREARQAKSFPAFRPWLEQIVALKRREAEAVGYAVSPYDALLDEFEPGTTAAEVTQLFAELAADLVPIVTAIRESGKVAPRAILEREFPVDQQQFFARAAAAAIGFDFSSGRLDTTAHPFCSGIGPGDCRITTRYNPRFFSECFFGVLHECGHGIYEQNLPADHRGTPLGTAASFGVHESQSRLWENQVGRGRPFWEHFFPRAQQTFASLAYVSLDDWLFAVNDVRPSFIRVEADEATYNLHIILRFELEQALLTGDLAAADVPGAWNDRFTAMFGLTPPDDALGCLQDVHWSFGGIGYFPTYTLGNLYAAQFMAKAKSDLPGLDEDFRRGDFIRLKGWLTDNIHCHGQHYRATELCERVTGSTLDHRPFLDYLRDKYTPFYDL